MKRLSRLTNILLRLQAGRLVKAEELAEKFNITKRTVYRDIRVLEEAGVPIIGVAGRGYTIMEGYRIPPVMFSQQEINALLTSLKHFKTNADVSAYNDLESLVTKIKAILRFSDKEKIEKMESRLYIYSDLNPKETKLLSIIQLAISDCRVLKIKYYSAMSDETLDRIVEPLAVYNTSGNWIMIAFCRLREGLRQFRLDRVLNLNTTTEIFPDQNFSIVEYFNSIYKK